MAQYNRKYEIKGFKIIDEKMSYFGAKYKDRKAFLHPRSSFASNVTHKQSLKICEMLTCGLILMHPRGLNEGTIRNHMAPILKEIKTLLHSNIAQHLPDGVIDNFIKNNFRRLYDDIEKIHPSTADVVRKNKI